MYSIYVTNGRWKVSNGTLLVASIWMLFLMVRVSDSQSFTTYLRLLACGTPQSLFAFLWKNHHTANLLTEPEQSLPPNSAEHSASPRGCTLRCDEAHLWTGSFGYKNLLSTFKFSALLILAPQMSNFPIKQKEQTFPIALFSFFLESIFFYKFTHRLISGYSVSTSRKYLV